MNAMDLESEANLTISLLNQFSGVFVQENLYFHAKHAAEAALRLREAIDHHRLQHDNIRQVLQGLLDQIKEGYSTQDLVYDESYFVRKAKELAQQ